MAPSEAKPLAYPSQSTVASPSPASDAAIQPPHKELYPMNNWTYDIALWMISSVVDLFFREVHPRGSWKIPRRGPVIFVAAPHANQVSKVSPAG
jgi:1-acyl-sn-glycerol-3-phosphate acyltransferase